MPTGICRGCKERHLLKDDGGQLVVCYHVDGSGHGCDGTGIVPEEGSVEETPPSPPAQLGQKLAVPWPEDLDEEVLLSTSVPPEPVPELIGGGVDDQEDERWE